MSQKSLRARMSRFSVLSAGVLGGSIVLTGSLLQISGSQAAVPEECKLPGGILKPSDLPAGESVIGCGAVGRVVRSGGIGVTIPSPGVAVNANAARADGGNDSLSVEVAADGTISFTGEDGSGVSSYADSLAAQAAASSACDDGFYLTLDQKEYDTYNWYIGDGGMPGALSRADAKAAFADAINNITQSYNNCDYSDSVSAKSQYEGYTTWESDISSTSTCTTPDGRSTWDAGNLYDSHVALTCSWSTVRDDAKNPLVEADTRYNTTDFNFTDNPGSSSCENKYDVRGVGTHEAGHIFGLADLNDPHNNLTMYGYSPTCSAKQRTLGKGDVLGLRYLY
jgi:hypothetical protein